MYRQINGQTYIRTETYRHTYIHSDRDRQTDIHTGREIQTHRQTNRKTVRDRHRHTDREYSTPITVNGVLCTP